MSPAASRCKTVAASCGQLACALPPSTAFLTCVCVSRGSLPSGCKHHVVSLMQVNANLTVYVALACLVAASGGVLFGEPADYFFTPSFRLCEHCQQTVNCPPWNMAANGEVSKC